MSIKVSLWKKRCKYCICLCHKDEAASHWIPRDMPLFISAFIFLVLIICSIILLLFFLNHLSSTLLVLCTTGWFDYLLLKPESVSHFFHSAIRRWKFNSEIYPPSTLSCMHTTSRLLLSSISQNVSLRPILSKFLFVCFPKFIILFI